MQKYCGGYKNIEQIIPSLKILITVNGNIKVCLHQQRKYLYSLNHTLISTLSERCFSAMNFLPAWSTLILFTSSFKSILKFTCSRKHSHWSLGPGLNRLFLRICGCRQFKVVWLLLPAALQSSAYFTRAYVPPQWPLKELSEGRQSCSQLSLCPLSVILCTQPMACC